MGNHYHLLIRTPHANASLALQWLNVSYSVWFNRRRRRVGHVFQGRFSSTLVDGEGSWALSASVYLHLNPVRTRAMGLGKTANRAEGRGVVSADHPTVVRRLKALRSYRWSSYGVYAGYRAAPEWLTTKMLLARSGGSKAYRKNVQRHVTRGVLPDGYEDFGGSGALGSQEFLRKVKDWVVRVTKEQPGRDQVQKRVSVTDVVKVVERIRGEAWTEFANRYGVCGRDLVLYLVRRRSGLGLREIGLALGIEEYKTVAAAIKRFEQSLEKDASRRKLVARCMDEMQNMET